MTAAVRFVNLVTGSLMLGGFVFGAVTVARAHVTMPPLDAWGFHRFVSRRVDWFIPASTLTATVTGWLLVAMDGAAGSEARALTLVGAALLSSYGAPFIAHRTGLRNEFSFLRLAANDLSVPDAMVRMRWWNRWHYYRTAVGGVAQICFILAVLAP